MRNYFNKYGNEYGINTEIMKFLSVHIEKVKFLTKLCAVITHNVSKTKELVVDFRRGSRIHTPLSIGGTLVVRVSCFKFLCVYLADSTW